MPTVRKSVARSFLVTEINMAPWYPQPLTVLGSLGWLLFYKRIHGYIKGLPILYHVSTAEPAAVHARTRSYNPDRNIPQSKHSELSFCDCLNPISQLQRTENRTL
ncbi:hypothetical protein I7I51_06960 [Histoplasma capsulatum]|uniref:Uncharacterized protein n=1 Tax=Ajellomyces capsulatus TaxID=5037 RepID=A0A8A1MJN3_AJECA|nr:hypothetical protein I7I51_06960 [Histoplasma capsulatum]